MERTAAREDGHIRELTSEQARELFNEAAEFYLGITGDEFLARWEAGEYDKDPDQPQVMNVAMLLPFAQHE
ncbi:MAG TPA: hypothetical protein VE288_12270 [Rubrobacteraceae bacterium]|jgi:hypothetical protein|nr:hypothetical protein [Rubrobacteraceae bacterium]